MCFTAYSSALPSIGALATDNTLMADPTLHSPTPPPAGEGPWLALLQLVPALRVAAGLVIAAVVVTALYVGRDLLIPIALAAFLGFLLDPAVSRLKRWGLPRALAVAIVSLCALGLLVGAGSYLTGQLRQLSADLPGYQDTITAKISGLRQELGGPSSWDGAVNTFGLLQRQIDQSVEPDPEVQAVRVVSSTGGPVATAVAWLERIGSPVATAGIVALFVVLILLDRDSLRDRVLRLMGGGNLHLATDALGEASKRIGRYLRMQLIVNATYGVPMAVGLWFIGVPGAVLWGALAVVMRFVPYLGPLISAVFPLALAFAVDPGWSMVLWTIGLIAVLELISNNVIEPWLYGSSTGLSTLSIIVAATFWTTLWGPIGLVLSTPLTVCLLVMGRYIPALGFMQALLGSEPVLDPPQRLYQRLLAGDRAEAADLALEQVQERIEDEDDPADVAEAVTAFYDEVGLAVLRLASSQHADQATAHHRLRLAAGMGTVLEELREAFPAAAPDNHGRRVHCLGARWEIDAFAAAMTAHALRHHGLDAIALPAPLGAGHAAVSALPLQAGDIVCVSLFHPDPGPQLEKLLRRLHRRHPDCAVVVQPWNAAGGDACPLPGAPLQAGTIAQLLLVLQARLHSEVGGTEHGSNEEPARLAALAASGALDARHHRLYADTARQAANAFDTRYAQVSWIDADTVFAPGALLPVAALPDGVARANTVCTHLVQEQAPLVIDDLLTDPRMDSLEIVQHHGLRFYAGVPLRHDGQVIGGLCIVDDQPRQLSAQDQALLERMADKLMQAITGP